jgi:hypothetical protein
VGIQRFPDSGHYVASAAKDDWWRYSFDVPQEGYVKIADLRVASPKETVCEFFWDEIRVGQLAFHTGSDANWRTYEMDISPFVSSAGVHTLRIRVASGLSNLDSFGVGFGWTPSKKKVIFADDFDAYADTEEVVTVGQWQIVNGSGDPEGAWRLWSTQGPPLADDQPGPDFPGFSSNYMVSNGDFTGPAQLDEELISPPIDCHLYVCVTVQFQSAINIYQQDTEGDLQTTDFDVSVYDETGESWSDWINLLTHDRTYGDDFSFIPKSIDVSSLADGQKVRLRWRFYNTHYDYWSAIDNVSVTGEERSPRITSSALTPDSSIALSWEAFGQGIYTVEFSYDLVNGPWQPVPGTQWPLSQTSWQGESSPGVRQQFFRVRSE